jgi:hypothetical protein
VFEPPWVRPQAETLRMAEDAIVLSERLCGEVLHLLTPHTAHHIKRWMACGEVAVSLRPCLRLVSLST